MLKNRYYRKTYGAPGLMELHLQIPTGHAVKPVLDIRFEGGQITGFGMAPARYVTTDPFEQRLIENSNYFKSGRVMILKSETLRV